ncbi:hypothetical protein [Aurantiacibacter flavus]|uniref:Uncharacterized protein n=1 Tax=Aurantiacibacter flavus TaxID=3145232 RepID=A0ABV0CYR6_9SPHN
MSDFAGCRLDRLEPGAHFLVSAMREWVIGAQSRRCVCATIDRAFTAYRVEQVAASFHRMMRTISGHAQTSIYFGQRDRETITAHEALLLEALAHSQAHNGEGEESVRRLASHLVHAPMAPTLAEQIYRISRSLDCSGHKVGVRAPGMAEGTLRGIVQQALSGLPLSLRSALWGASDQGPVSRDV